MKKLLTTTLAMALMIGITQVSAQAKDFKNRRQNENSTPKSIMFEHQKPNKEQMRKEFEQRLNLSEEQKQKAKKVHEKGKAEIQPIFMQMEVKHQEIKNLKLSDLSENERKQKMEQLKTEIRALNKQAHEIRKKNSEEFEQILNKDQKAELEKMKAEGRAKFEKKHPPRAPFQGIQQQNFKFKQLQDE